MDKNSEDFKTFFKTVTSGINMDKEKEKELGDDFKAYMDKRAQLLNDRKIL